MHNGATDVKSVQNLQGGNNNNKNNYCNLNNSNSNHDNQNQNNQQSCNPTQFFPRNNNNYSHDYDPNRKFTNFREPLDAIFQKLVDHNLMVFPSTWTFDENQPKLKWYRENEYCKYHFIKGHDTNKYIKLKVFIQNLVNDGEIEVEGGPPSKNAKLNIFQKPFPDHNNDNNNYRNNVNQASTSNALHYDYSTNHISGFDSLCGKVETNDICGFDSMHGRIEEVDTHVNTLVLQADDCDATTWWGRITLQAATPDPTNPLVSHALVVPSTS